jgi:hypothetical protein
MSNIVKPRPQNHHEILNEALGDNVQDPALLNRSFIDYNRGNDVSAKGDAAKDMSISLLDIDTAIMKHIEETIKPSIFQDGNRIFVPVMYGYPERWQTIQEKGTLREYSGRMIAPVIVLKRDSMENNRTLGTKIDPSVPYNLHVFETLYTKKNQYDNFSVLSNRTPIKEFRLSVMPEYVTLTYSAVIFTNHLEQNNKIIEAFQYDENSYWGEEDRFRFRVMIDAFNTSTEYSVGDDRTTRTNFNITLNGYIIPDTVNRDISYPKKFLSKSQVVFNIETDTNEVFTVGGKAKKSRKAQSVITQGANRILTIVNPEILTYVNTNKQLIASTIIAPNQAVFGGASILQPPINSGLPDTTVSDFRFFVRGNYVDLSVIQSIQQVGLDVIVIFNTLNLGYTLNSTDTVMAIGKFN